MILSLVLWACANKSLTETEEAEGEQRAMDAKTGVMVSEMETMSRVAEVRIPSGQATVRECFGKSSSYRGRSGSSSSASAPPPAAPQGQYASGPSVGTGSASGYGSGGSAGSTSTRSVSASPPVVTAVAPKAAQQPSVSTPTPSATPRADAYAVTESAPAPESAAAYAPMKSSPSPDPVMGGAVGTKSVAKAKSPSAKPNDMLDAPMEPTVAQGLSGIGYIAGNDEGDNSSLSAKGSRGKTEERKAGGTDKDAGFAKESSMTDDARYRDAEQEIAEKKGERLSRADIVAREEQARRSSMDWGAKTYLSNDDSMSLASAQRLLWAVQNRGPVQTSQIRPHEFLNYFSFDTTPVNGDDTFSVLASAEQTAPGKMTMAMAVKGATPERKPLDVTLVLDRSGSMSAEGRMEYLKRGLTKMTDQLERGDRVDVVLFDDKLCTPLEDFVVGRDDPSLLSDVIASLQPRGSTNVDIGLKEGYKIANARPMDNDRSQRMILISDALLNEGELDVNMVSDIGKSYDSRGIRLSAVGVGRDFNDKVLDMLSDKGKGAYVYLGSEAVVDRVFGAGFNSLTQTVAHDVHFSLDLPDSLAIERFYGEESSTVKADVQAINYYAGTTQLFLQDLAMSGSTPVYDDPVTLTAEWTDVDTGEARKQVFRSNVGRLLRADNRNLHKGQALMAWTDLIMARSMGGDPCGQPYDVWSDRVQALGEDAEIAWLDGLTSPLCGQRPATTKLVASSSVSYKVKVDSDQVIAEVGMMCGSKQRSVSLSGNVARFDVAPGDCQLVLYGNVPLYAQVEVPQTGGDVRCVVRGGRLSCS